MTKRRELMARRDAALAKGDTTAFQALTRQIAELPLTGVKRLTDRDIKRYAERKQR